MPLSNLKLTSDAHHGKPPGQCGYSQTVSKIEKSAEKVFDSLKAHLRKLPKDPSAVRIHKIRVLLKKTKAIINLLDYTFKKFRGHQEWIPFRTIFRAMAYLRQSDVLIALLLKFEVEGIKDQLTTAGPAAQMTELNDQIPIYIDTIRKRSRHLQTYLTKVRKKQIIEYLEDKNHEIKGQLYPRADMHSIHKTRKAIKEVIYLAEVVGGQSRRRLKLFKMLEERIGKLHDKQTLLKLLQTHRGPVHDAKRELIRAACVKDEVGIYKLSYRHYR